MASTQPSMNELSSEEYARRFKEAYDLHMPPYDFRVWNRYLFSRCSNGGEVLGLMSLFKWLVDVGDYSKNAEGIGQICMKSGAFIAAVKSAIEMTEKYYPNKEVVNRDLAFIKAHQSIFKDGPIPEFSEVSKEKQKAWLIQARFCILSKDPRDSALNEDKRHEKQLNQEAYFAFGALAWNIPLEPKWGLQDLRLDVWYKLGFGIATRPEWKAELLSQYQKHFSFVSVMFEYFMYHWSCGLLAQKLQEGLESKHSVFWGHLTKFCKKGFTEEQESVFRLHQAVSLMDEAYLLLVTKTWDVFNQATENYRLDEYPEKEERKSIAQKSVYYHVLRHIEDPMALHEAMKGGTLREFISKTYEKHGTHLSEETLDVACCTY